MRERIEDQQLYLNKRMAVPNRVTDYTYPENKIHINQNNNFGSNLLVVITARGRWILHKLFHSAK